MLLVVTAKFDLKTKQFDSVNVFMHADLDETV